MRAPAAVASAPSRAVVEGEYPSVLRHQPSLSSQPQSDPFADRFGRALRGLPRPRFDAVAGRARKALDDLPRPSLDGIADRAKDALQGLPRPRFDGVVDRTKTALAGLSPHRRLGAAAQSAKKAIKRVPQVAFGGVSERARRVAGALPRPARVAERVRLALSGLPNPKVIAISGGVGLLLVFGFGGMLAMRNLDNDAGTKSRQMPSPAAAAKQQGEPDADGSQQQLPRFAEAPLAEADAPSEPASKSEAPPQPRAPAEVAEPAAVEDIDRADAQESAPPVEVQHPGAVATDVVPVAPPSSKETPVEGVAGIEVQRPVEPSAKAEDVPVKDAGGSADAMVRLAFATRSDDKPKAPEVGTGVQAHDGADEAPIQSYVGQPAKPRKVEDSVQPTELPKPTTLAKAPVPELKPDTPEVSPQVQGAPTSVLEYLSFPKKSSDWIKVFIKDFYLSEDALPDADVRRIYSREVDYFGKHKTSIDEVAREKAEYYRQWPKRHYELVPGSIDIAWKSPDVADISFTYRYKVSAPKRKTSIGRGRAHLTLDLSGHAGLIVREDGEVIAHN
jgi:hypothetical protein